MPVTKGVIIEFLDSTLLMVGISIRSKALDKDQKEIIARQEVAHMVENKTSDTLEKRILLISIFIAGLCSIIYELLIGTTSSYFLGDSIKHFSLTVGVYMAAMGVGSYLSRYVNDKVIEAFIFVEIILAFFGGISVPILYLLFSLDSGYMIGMILCLAIIGILTGFEIPLLSRILSTQYSLRENLSNVLSLDYVGALIATLCFPFLILPFIGIFKTSLVFGLINLGVGVLNIIFLKSKIQHSQKWFLKLSLITVALFLGLMLLFSNVLLASWEQGLYSDRIIDVKQSQYQKIVLTKHKDDLRLFLDGNLQFSSIDEYRYHEVIVHVPLSLIDNPKRILILGGGDGLAARELLKYPQIESILIVDLDKAVSDICTQNAQIRALNQSSLTHPKVTLRHDDAFGFIRNNKDKYDLIIADLPDPNNTALARLYSKEFYHWVNDRLTNDGLFITQASSPIFSRSAFWCVNKTVRAGGFPNTFPFHVYVPSFGDWGFVMAGNKKQLTPQTLPPDLKFLNKEIYASLFQFATDETEDNVAISSLDRPLISKYYEDGWLYWK